jgi:hypothetical protein
MRESNAVSEAHLLEALVDRKCCVVDMSLNGVRQETSNSKNSTLWRNVTRAPWFLARRLHGAGLELQWAGTAQTVRARRGEPAARIAGPPGELLLYLFGRQSAAHVEVSGPDAAIEAVRRARLGM